MAVSGLGPASGAVLRDPWRARVRDRHGAVLGAGILVTDRRVLTCAHVVPAAARSTRNWPMSVDFLGAGSGAPPRVLARVADGGWVPVPPPEDSDTTGDLALLELDQVVHLPPAPLRRQFPLPDRRVRLCGYPELRDAGVWVNAIVAGRSGSWFQLDLDRVDDVQPGFSGAGVFDPATDAVIGMVVARAAGTNQRPICWMVPMADVVGRLPDLGAVVTGEKFADDTFLTRRETVLDRTLSEPVHRLAGALTSAGGGLVFAFSAHDERRSAAFGLLVTTADREIGAGRRADLLTGPRGSLPMAVAVDIAVDATGRTTRDVTSRLAGYVGIATDDPKELVRALGTAAKSLTMVVDCVDDAAEPASLFADLLLPLASAGARVLAGGRGTNLPGAAAAHVNSVDLDVPDDADDPPTLPYLPAPARLDRLDALVEQAAATAAAAVVRRADVARRILHPPQLTDHVTSLRLKVADLRRQVAAQPTQRLDAPDVHQAIDAAERRTYRVRRQAEQFRVVLEGLVARRDELRGRLDGYHRIHVSLGEDVDLSKLYNAARDLLWHGPCDLDAAEAAVTAYLRAVDEKRGDHP